MVEETVSSGCESEDQQPESSKTAAKRKKWDIEDSFELLRQVKTKGKNWDAVLQELHRQHRATHINKKDYDKVRKHYNTLNSPKSSLRKPYKVPPLKLSTVERKTLSKEDIEKRQREHDAKHALHQREREIALATIAFIEQNEILKSSEGRESEETIRKEMAEKATERRQARDEKFAKQERLAEEELKFRNGSLGMIFLLSGFLAANVAQERRVLDLMEEHLQYKKAKRQWKPNTEAAPTPAYSASASLATSPPTSPATATLRPPDYNTIELPRLEQFSTQMQRVADIFSEMFTNPPPTPASSVVPPPSHPLQPPTPTPKRAATQPKDNATQKRTKRVAKPSTPSATKSTPTTPSTPSSHASAFIPTGPFFQQYPLPQFSTFPMNQFQSNTFPIPNTNISNTTSPIPNTFRNPLTMQNVILPTPDPRLNQQ